MSLPVDWLLFFLLIPSYLTSAVDKSHVRMDTMVCTGRQAHFNWKYEVRNFSVIALTHNTELITFSSSLLLAPERIKSDQFKGRLMFNSEDPFSFTLENATKGDNGMYECIFLFEDGSTDSLMGKLEVKDFHDDNTLVEAVEKKDRCVTLSCKTDSPCTWTFSNKTTEVAKEIQYCLNEPTETIKCESDHVCKYAIYTNCSKSSNKRQKRSSRGICLQDDSNSDDYGKIGAVPSTDPVPIVLGVLGGITAIAVITVVIVFYKRRSRIPREQEPPGSDILVPIND